MSETMCRRCDGTGWVEGGTAIRTPCTYCAGHGVVVVAPPTPVIVADEVAVWPTPPAPPGLDWEAAKREALAKFCARFSCTPEDIKKYEESLFEVGVWIKDALQNQHLAALQQARKDKDTEWYARQSDIIAQAKRDERARIVKAVREKAGDAPNDPALDTDYEVGWYGGMITAADFIEKEAE